ncbi:adenylyltransferase and sulfurtransferase MOCS3 isoform X2 [Rhinatrema bivittatum]|uniref:adenylyltransferase and sulfurtransferase MOCS3 isoform X2 n=1 Tax=Rhinatrema bivittatum TaxID=194408 RepID=UPI00112B4D70|nr:adenylyltransferase and sulfurtransferase MOCS3 isoform X2 [Rhinatrema bivittatum]
MFAAGDMKLQDLLIQNLENNLENSLHKIKQNKTPLVSESFQKFLNTRNGYLISNLVTEFLQFFSLEFTLAVFQPETGTLRGPDRGNLAQDLGIAEDESTKAGPLLLEVMKQCQSPNSRELSPAFAALKNDLGVNHNGKYNHYTDGPCDSTLPVLHNLVMELPLLEIKPFLTNRAILRYSRQLVLPELGVKGQLNLSKSSVLIVGCGGLGCPLAQYLAAAGIGRLGLLDYDVVEVSNLHRQVLHGEDRQGMAKSLSAATTLKQLNSEVEYICYNMTLNPEVALELIRQYDIIADCSDNVPTRYLVSDACVLTGKPLVSASALRMEGQLTIFNYHGSPCYRCLFPVPPPLETVTNCADSGVLGIVPGIMGCLQALEVLKIASGMGTSFSQFMLMFDALEGRFRNIRLRPKNNNCAVCGTNPTVRVLQDYEAFCGSSASDKCRTLHLLSKEERISAPEYKKILDEQVPHLLIDVRPQVEVDICRLPHSVHIPLCKLERKNLDCLNHLDKKILEGKLITAEEMSFPVYVICKLGNDSQKAVKILQELSGKELDLILAKDITGGLMAWSNKVDPTFPQY